MCRKTGGRRCRDPRGLGASQFSGWGGQEKGSQDPGPITARPADPTLSPHSRSHGLFRACLLSRQAQPGGAPSSRKPTVLCFSAFPVLRPHRSVSTSLPPCRLLGPLPTAWPWLDAWPLPASSLDEGSWARTAAPPWRRRPGGGLRRAEPPSSTARVPPTPSALSEAPTGSFPHVRDLCSQTRDEAEEGRVILQAISPLAAQPAGGLRTARPRCSRCAEFAHAMASHLKTSILGAAGHGH